MTNMRSTESDDIRMTFDASSCLVQVEGSSVTDADGLSGGPIFGMTALRDGNLIYKCIGIQSGWYRKKKILYASPIDRLADFLDRSLSETDGELSLM